MSKVTPETAEHYYKHRTPEKVEEYNDKNAAAQMDKRDKEAEMEDARSDREGAREGRPHGNSLK